MRILITLLALCLVTGAYAQQSVVGGGGLSTVTLVSQLGTNTPSDGQVPSATGDSIKWVNAAGSGDVIAAGQNNFSGSNYFGGGTRFGAISVTNNVIAGLSALTNSGNMQSATLNTTGNMSVGGSLTVTTGPSTLTGGVMFTNPTATTVPMQIGMNGTSTNDFQIAEAGVLVAAFSNAVWYANGGGVTNVNSTNVTVNPTVITATSQQTNYTIPLLPGPSGNMLTIYTINTNVFFTLTGTNKADWQRTICLRGFTNTIDTQIQFASRVRTNLNYIATQTNGTCRILNLYNLDTSGTNVLVSDAGTYK